MEMIQCVRCGSKRAIKDMIISVKNGERISLFCKSCYSLLGHCPTCKNKRECGFFEDSNPLPQFVIVQQMQQRENGYVITQRQVPNTERLREFCLDGKCICCYEQDPKNPMCCRFTDEQTCGNYIEEEYI